jgi:SsrA-binding protein
MNKPSSELISNKRALFNFEVIDTYEAGIVLQGTEIKSLRNHGGSLQDSWVKVSQGELWLVGCSIAPYKFGNIHNHEERRERKLLMHGYEINKLKAAIQEKGLTLIPLSFYFKEGRVKVKLALGRGKKSVDKRATLKERDDKRSMQKVMKQHNQK